MQQNTQYKFRHFVRDMISNGSPYTQDALELIFNYISTKCTDCTVFNMHGKNIYDYVVDRFDEFTFDYLRNKIYNDETHLKVTYFQGPSDIVDQYVIYHMRDCFYNIIGYGIKHDKRTMVLVY